MHLYKLKRHSFQTYAHFDYSLAVSFAYSSHLLEPLLPSGLTLDTYTAKNNNEETTYAFFTIAMVKVKQLHPAFLPKAFGQNFFLTGYRLFVRYKDKSGRTLRGLYVLRSDSSNSQMTFLGNFLTHYKYSHARIIESQNTDTNLLNISIKTQKNIADVDLSVDLSHSPTTPPVNSPFPDLKTARRFAGPMPYTFSYEPETDSIVIIEGRRQNWQPENVAVDIKQASYLEQEPFSQATPLIANAFMVKDVPYSWKKGILEKL